MTKGGDEMTNPDIVRDWCLERVGCTASPARTADGNSLSAEE